MLQLPTRLFACASLIACGPDIAEKRAEWRARAPDSYVVGVCSYGLGGGPCQLSAVQQGQVVEAEYWHSIERAWLPVAEPTEPIDALFDAIDDTDCSLDVDFDTKYSYPREFWLNCGEEGYGETVECFAPDSLDLEACRSSTFFDP
jgi:hypothetical protein